MPGLPRSGDNISTKARAGLCLRYQASIDAKAWGARDNLLALQQGDSGVNLPFASTVLQLSRLRLEAGRRDMNYCAKQDVGLILAKRPLEKCRPIVSGLPFLFLGPYPNPEHPL